jgi:hypothetical protein
MLILEFKNIFLEFILEKKSIFKLLEFSLYYYVKAFIFLNSNKSISKIK